LCDIGEKPLQPVLQKESPKYKIIENSEFSAKEIKIPLPNKNGENQSLVKQNSLPKRNNNQLFSNNAKNIFHPTNNNNSVIMKKYGKFILNNTNNSKIK